MGNIVEALEYRGVLIFPIDTNENDFSGMNGTVNNRPYIVFRAGMSAERIRSTIIHEAAHFAFNWPDSISDKSVKTGLLRSAVLSFFHPQTLSGNWDQREVM